MNDSRCFDIGNIGVDLANLRSRFVIIISILLLFACGTATAAEIVITSEKRNKVLGVVNDHSALEEAMKAVRSPVPPHQEDELAKAIYEMLSRWLPYAERTFEEWPQRPRCGHFFGGRWYYGSETANTALAYAVLAKLGCYRQDLAGISREEVRERAIHAIRYLCFTHDLGPEGLTRPDGRKWGGLFRSWNLHDLCQTSVPYLAAAAWLLWDDLDEETRSLAARVIIGTTERWSLEWPLSGREGDTKAEEDGTVAGLLAMGAIMFNAHPRAPHWENMARCWMINVRTVPADRSDTTFIDGNKVSEWVRTANLHPDFTLENHGFVHSDYLCSSILHAVHAGLPYILTGREVPLQDLHHLADVYELYKKWMEWDGNHTFVNGTHWWYGGGLGPAVAHSGVALLLRDPDAAFLERVFLERVRSIQASDPQARLFGGFEESYEHAPARTLSYVYLLHRFGGPGPDPTPEAEFHRKISGVNLFKDGRLITHRRPASMTVFAWGTRPMAFALPEGGTWVLTPTPHGFIGRMGGTRKLVRASHVEEIEDGFLATARLRRGVLTQAVSFVSLPGNVALFQESVVANDPIVDAMLESGTIGVRNEDYRRLPELASGRRTIHFPEKSLIITTHGEGFTEEVQPWVNIDDRIGYVLQGSRGLLDDNNRGTQGSEHLLHLTAGLVTAEAGEVVSRFSAVIYPNQDHAETRRLSERSIEAVSSEPLTGCAYVPARPGTEVPDRLVVFNGASARTTLVIALSCDGETIPLFEGAQSIVKRGLELEVTLDGVRSVVLPAVGHIRKASGQVGDWYLSVNVAYDGRVGFTNHAQRPAELVLVRDGHKRSVKVDVGQSYWVEARSEGAD
jgi:hypothetical protein